MCSYLPKHWSDVDNSLLVIRRVSSSGTASPTASRPVVVAVAAVVDIVRRRIEEIGDGYIFANELVAQDWYYNNEYKFGKMKDVKEVVIELMASNTYGIGDIITAEDKKLGDEKREEKRMQDDKRATDFGGEAEMEA